MAAPGDGVAEWARDDAQALLGMLPGAVELVQRRDDVVVALVDAGAPLVLKITGPDVDAERTEAVVALARAAGVPVPAVVATGPSAVRAGWRCVLSERAEGEQWRAVRPRLAPGEVTAAHEALATVLLAVQSVRFPRTGELQVEARAVGVVGSGDVADALRRRAALRVSDAGRRAVFEQVLVREALLLEQQTAAVLCHDDLHSANVLFARTPAGWRLSAVLDWDKAWAGPAESDVARMGFWDDMTGPGFWAVYRAAVPAAEGAERRALVHRLLWCFEYDSPSRRHAADTAGVCRALGVSPPG